MRRSNRKARKQLFRLLGFPTPRAYRLHREKVWRDLTPFRRIGESFRRAAQDLADVAGRFIAGWRKTFPGLVSRSKIAA